MTMPTQDEITRAVRLGRMAGRDRLPVLSSCPYGADQPVLKYRWATGYAEGKTDAAADWWENLKARLAAWWYGDEEDQ